MNWAIYLTTIGAILAGAGFLHQLLIKRKEATIETLTEKNKWLEKQLEAAEKNSSDVLTERLGKRIQVFQTELERLSKDHDANESLIKSKEEEIRQMKELMADVAIEIGRQAGEFRDFRSNYVCPTCGTKLITLKTVEEIDYSGRLREYACGYSEVDGATITMCPCDFNYPTYEQMEVQTKYNSTRNEWSAFFSSSAVNTYKLRQIVISGKTKEEAESNMRLIYDHEQEKCEESQRQF